MAEETDENTEETDENSDHNVGMLEGEANGVSDLVSHQDRIGTNGTIVDASRLESILFPPRTPIFPNGSMRTSNIHTIDLCVHRLLEFHCMIRLQLRTAGSEGGVLVSELCHSDFRWQETHWIWTG